MYLIYPDADLCFWEAAMVIACIFLFVAVLCYLGSNQLQFTPNHTMFFNYFFGIDDSKGFVRLIKSIIGDHVQSEDERIQTDAKKKSTDAKHKPTDAKKTATKPRQIPAWAQALEQPPEEAQEPTEREIERELEREIKKFKSEHPGQGQDQGRIMIPESIQRELKRQYDRDFAKSANGQIQAELRRQLARPSSEIDWDYVQKNYRNMPSDVKKTADELYASKMAEISRKDQQLPQRDGFAQRSAATSNIVNRLISKSMVSGNKVSMRL